MAGPRRQINSGGRFGLYGLILISLILLVSQRQEALTRRDNPQIPSDIQAPVAQWVSAPIRSIETYLSDLRDRRKASEENVALRAELTVLRTENLRLQSLQFELDRLSRLLDVDLDVDLRTDGIAARVVSDPASPFVRSYLLGAGRDAGIEDGSPVLSDAGLVGHIVTVGRRSSRVLRLDDLNSRVAVMSGRSGARAILAGANADIADLAFISDIDGWQPGDRILTSGDDGQLPQGLPVGTVRDDRVSATLDFRTVPTDWVLVMPFSAIPDIDDPAIDDPITTNAPESDAGLTQNDADVAGDTSVDAASPDASEG